MYPQRILKCLFALILTAGIFTSPTFAQNSESDNAVAGFKIGVVNVKDIFDNYQKQVNLMDELKVTRDELQVDIDAMSASIEADKKTYEENKSKMTEDERRDAVEKIESDFSDYQAEFKKRQDDVNRREKRISDEVLGDINKAINELGLKQNYHLIFESGSSPRSALTGLVYFSSTLNMSQRVIDHLNEQYKKK